MDMTKYAGSESKYLKASDLQGKRPTVVIESVELVEFEDDEKGKVTKPALKLKGKEKKLVLSPSFVEEVIRAFGADSSGWIGKSLGLSTKYYKSFDRDGIVVTPLLNDVIDDDIPF